MITFWKQLLVIQLLCAICVYSAQESVCSGLAGNLDLILGTLDCIWTILCDSVKKQIVRNSVLIFILNYYHRDLQNCKLQYLLCIYLKPEAG